MTSVQAVVSAEVNVVDFNWSTFVPVEGFNPSCLIVWLNVHESVELTQVIVLSVAPLRVIPPPSAVVSLGVVTSPKIIFLSSSRVYSIESLNKLINQKILKKKINLKKEI